MSGYRIEISKTEFYLDNLGINSDKETITKSSSFTPKSISQKSPTPQTLLLDFTIPLTSLINEVDVREKLIQECNNFLYYLANLNDQEFNNSQKKTKEFFILTSYS